MPERFSSDEDFPALSFEAKRAHIEEPARCKIRLHRWVFFTAVAVATWGTMKGWTFTGIVGWGVATWMAWVLAMEYEALSLETFDLLLDRAAVGSVELQNLASALARSAHSLGCLHRGGSRVAASLVAYTAFVENVTLIATAAAATAAIFLFVDVGGAVRKVQRAQWTILLHEVRRQER